MAFSNTRDIWQTQQGFAGGLERNWGRKAMLDAQPYHDQELQLAGQEARERSADVEAAAAAGAREVALTLNAMDVDETVVDMHALIPAHRPSQ